MRAQHALPASACTRVLSTVQ
jgi:hypothetical protein